MTHDTTTIRPADQTPAEDYRTSEGLRALLNRLHAAGKRAWEHDPVAAELMQFAAEKYAALATKHRLDPWEAASAAFDVMRTTLLVYDEIEDIEGKKRRVLNPVETTAAQEKADAIQERFGEWVWEDPERARTSVDSNRTPGRGSSG